MALESAYEFVTRNGLARRLYNYLCYRDTKKDIMNDLEHDYLTINDGFDGKTYIWYADEINDVAIRVEDGRIIDGTEGILWWE